jgi:Reverse transcriptase (RNA-dependent DNA polymerase)
VFKTSEELFEPTVMFFGLCNSPVTFQTIMDEIFQDKIQERWVKIYMDDIVIATTDDEVLHSLWVKHILNKLTKKYLFLKPEKCHFHQHEVEYLGVIIGNGKICMDPIKLKGITNWLANTYHHKRSLQLSRILQLLLCLHPTLFQYCVSTK